MQAEGIRELHPYFQQSDCETVQYDIHELFAYYNERFFFGRLGACVVRWTKKMTLCAGTCSYKGDGSPVIALSQPLLKFRTNNEMKQTLLHEMIHAYLFLTNLAACRVDDGHGPAFLEIMYRINSVTGLKLSVYHQFQDQVNFYRKHIWRCNGPCQHRPPFFGYVKRSMNRPPQPADHWFANHKKNCGGVFEKISGPQEKKVNPEKKQKGEKRKKKSLENKNHRDWGIGKSIEQYMKEMSKENQDRKSKKDENSQSHESETINSEKQFKNIEQYSYEIPKEHIIKEEND